MKNSSLFILFFISLFSCTRENPVTYNDLLIGPQIEMVAYLDSIISVPDNTLKEISDYRKNLTVNALRGTQITDSLSSFKEDNAYRKAAAEYYKYSLELFDENDLDSLFLKLNQNTPIKSADSIQLEILKQKLQKYVDIETELLSEQMLFLERFKIAPNR